MNADKRALAAYFDGLAEDWDGANQLDREMLKKLLDLADIRPGVQVLDVACGTGRLFQAYLDRGAKSVTGVDISAKMLAQAERKFHLPNVHLIQADIQACRFDHPFDRCVLWDALPHFPEPGQLLRRLAGFVKPGGRLTAFHRLEKEGPWDAQTLARQMAPWFLVDVAEQEGAVCRISGMRNDAPAGLGSDGPGGK